MKTTATAATAALLLLAAAGCSSSSSPGHATSAYGTTAAAAGTTTAPATAPTTAVARAKGGNTASYCTLITKNNAVLQDIAAGDTRRGGVDATKLLHDLDAEAAAAPAAIKGDMQTVVAFDRQLITKHTEIKETPQLNAALRHYATWVGTHCARGTTH